MRGILRHLPKSIRKPVDMIVKATAFFAERLSPTKRGAGYLGKVAEEIATYKKNNNVHDLPEIFHYWSNKFLRPIFTEMGFNNSQELYLQYMSTACRNSSGTPVRFASIGSGNCDIEVSLAANLIALGHDNFELECIDVNNHMLKRGRLLAKEQKVEKYLTFANVDVNHWHASHGYEIIIANQSLHHFVELEVLFDKIRGYLKDNGYFITHDMIGRNGHMRWPEVMELVDELWRDLPEKYTFNNQLLRFEPKYENWDCSKNGFEGVRAQDILPLLIDRFNFELFVPWGGLIDIFIDRSFGHNFEKDSEWDRNFIDKVHHMNVQKIRDGIIKPTQMIAVLTKQPASVTRNVGTLTPLFCVRT